MSRFLVATWDGAGNLVPTLGITAALVAAGHDVRLLGHPAVQARYRTQGWRAVPFRRTTPYDITERIDVANETETFATDIWFNPAVAADVLETLAEEPADVLVADCMLFGALSAGQVAGLPTVALFHTPISLFRAGPLVELFHAHLPALHRMRAGLGAQPVRTVAELHDLCTLGLVATPREFDVPLDLPLQHRFVGPILSGPRPHAEEQVPPLDPHAPLILVSFSTSFQEQKAVLQTTVGALGRLPVQVVVTTGWAIDPAEIRTPPNCTAVRFVPHDRLLASAAAVVNHAGLGTVMSTLAHGVPMVCVPLGRDQFFNAAMVERLGVGITVAPGEDPDRLRAAVETILNDPAPRAAATRFATCIAGYGGARAAVAELENCARDSTVV